MIGQFYTGPLWFIGKSTPKPQSPISRGVYFHKYTFSAACPGIAICVNRLDGPWFQSWGLFSQKHISELSASMFKLSGFYWNGKPPIHSFIDLVWITLSNQKLLDWAQFLSLPSLTYTPCFFFFLTTDVSDLSMIKVYIFQAIKAEEIDFPLGLQSVVCHFSHVTSVHFVLASEGKHAGNDIPILAIYCHLHDT